MDCSITDIAKIIGDFEVKIRDMSLEDVDKAFNELFSKYAKNPIDMQTIIDGFLNEDLTLFFDDNVSIKYLNKSYLESLRNSILNSDTFDIRFDSHNKQEKLDNAVELAEKEDNKLNYLQDYFGSDSTARSYFIKYMDDIVYDYLINDRTDPNYPKFVSTQQGFNQQLRRLQLRFIDTILNFYKTNTILTRSLHSIDKLQEYRDDFEKGEDLFNIHSKIKEFVKPFFEDKTLFGESFINRIGISKNNQQMIDALFSYIGLFKFDNMLKTILGDSIQIPNHSFNHISENKQYRIAPKSEMSDSWRNEEELIDDTEEIGGLTKSLIAHLPLYVKVNGHWVKSSQRRLNFKQFVNSKVTLNDSLNNPEIQKNAAYSDIRDKDDLIRLLAANDSPEERKRIENIIERKIANKTLYQIISTINDNVIENAPIALFFFSRTSYFNNLPIESQQAIISALHGIFDMSNPESYIRMALNAEKDNIIGNDTDIKQSLNILSKTDYFMYCAQMFGSIDKINSTSYVNDTDNDTEQNIVARQRLSSKDAKYRARNLIEQLNGKNNAQRHVIFNENGDAVDTFEQLYGVSIDTSKFNPEEKMLTFRCGANNHNYELTVKADDSKMTITLFDNGKKLTMNDYDAYKLALNTFATLFNSILPFDVSYNSSFMNDYDNPYAIFNFAGHVLYRKAVNEKCFNPNYTSSRMKQECNKYLGLTSDNGGKNWSMVTLRMNTNQLELFDKSIYPEFYKLSDAYDVSRGIIGEQMVKDQQGNMRGQVKLSQLSGKHEYLWSDSRQNKNNPASHFVLYDLFEDVDFLIDFKDADGNIIKVSDFNPSELIVSNFLYDFWGSMAQNGKLYAIGPVISDKPNIPRIGINIDKEIRYITLENGEHPTVRYLLNNDDKTLLKEVWNHEFGLYYIKQYNFVSKNLSLLNDVHKSKDNISLISDIFSISEDDKTILSQYIQNGLLSLPLYRDIFTNGMIDNYNRFNEYTNELLNNLKGFISYLQLKDDKTDDDIRILQSIGNILQYTDGRQFKNMFIHSLISSNDQIKFIDNLFGHFEGKNFRSNHLLIDAIIRYSNDDTFLNSIDPDYRNKYWSNVTSSREYNDEIFPDYDSRFISDIIKEDTYLKIDKDNPLYKDKKNTGSPSTKLIQNEKWYRSDSDIMLLGKLKYQDKDISIATYNDLVNSQLYKDIQGIINYGLIDQSYIGFDIRTLTVENDVFEFQNLIKFVNNPIFESLLHELQRIRSINDAYYSLDKEKRSSIKEILQQYPSYEAYALEYNNEDIINRYVLYGLADDEINNILGIKIQPEYTNYSLTTFEVNPAVSKYNIISMMFNEMYTLSSVGSYLNHPFTKSGNENIREMEASAMGARVKRNVSFTATKHQDLLNSLNGVSSKINICVVKDIDDEVYNLIADGVKSNGQKFSIPRQLSNDGATFVDPSMSYLENNSLQNEAVGTDKKQFGHMLDPESGTGFILKTAGFALTNDRLRNSRQWYQLLKHMRSVKWLKEGETFNGESYVDFTRDYYGRKINFAQMGIYFARFADTLDQKGKPIISHYKLLDVQYNKSIGEDGKVIGWQIQVKRLQNPIKGQNNETDENNVQWETVGEINSNYDLWSKVLGGEFSESYKKYGHDEKLTYFNDDSSNRNLSILMNLVGVRRRSITEFTGGIQKAANTYFNATDIVLSQEDVRQPLKESMVAYAATEGAVKQGATNVNENDIYTNPDYKMTTMSLIAKDLGVQLNAEHTVEESNIAIMTQVMNAAAARGYSIEQGSEIYRILHDVALDSAKEALSNIQMGTDESMLRLQYMVADIIIKSLKRTSVTDSNILQSIANNISNMNFTEDKDKLDFIKETIPIDNPSILRQIVSKVSISLQKSSVKLRPRGNMDVLVPSNGFVQLYDDKLLSEYGTYELAMKYLSAKQQEREADPSNYLSFGSQIRLGRTYKYTINGALLQTKVNNPEIYWNLRDRFAKGEITNLIEDITQPRELSEAVAEFEGIDSEGKREKYNIWDLAIVRERWVIEHKIARLQQQLKESQDNDESAQLIDAINNLIDRRRQILIDLQKQLNIIDYTKNNGFIEVFAGFDDNDNVVSKTVEIDKETLEVAPFEAIMPMSFKTDFMLTEGDSLQDIVNNPLFFLQRLARLYNTCEIDDEDYDIVLLGTQRNTYLAYKGNKTLSDSFHRLNIATIIDNGKCYRVDPSTYNTMYEIPMTESGNPNIEVYEDQFGNEVIVTNDIDFFIQNQHYVSINISPEHTLKVDDKEDITSQQELINILLTSTDQTLNRYANYILNGGIEGSQSRVYDIDAAKQYYDNANTLSNRIVNVVQDKIDEADDLFKDLSKKSRIMHNSFLKSLEAIVSRTPAQCQQSFMAMKAVAFDKSGLNSIMVSRFQLYFQGSDFDIDKANVLTHYIRNGYYAIWSPLYNMSGDVELREACDNLPFPTGRELNEQTSVQGGNKFSDLINKFGILLEYKKGLPSRYITRLSKLIEYINTHDVELDFDQDLGQKFRQFSNAFGAAIKDIKERGQQTTSALTTSIVELQEYIDNKEWGNVRQRINALPQIIRNFIDDAKQRNEGLIIDEVLIFNLLNDITQNINNYLNNRQILNDINRHNMYFVNNPKLDKRQAALNRVSTLIYNISRNPVNWIQGWSSVDVVTGPFKDAANKSDKAKEAKTYTGRSVVAIAKQQQATIEGKKNVGIAANSLKVYEAIAHAVYNTLAYGTDDEIRNLLFNIKINGNNMRILANAWANNMRIEEMPDDVKESLLGVDQTIDAYTALSALLSLAADNAKDPTLFKINASPEMIGLYTAGIFLGIEPNQLVDIINSKTGNI